jgi:outer membrane protein
VRRRRLAIGIALATTIAGYAQQIPRLGIVDLQRGRLPEVRRRDALRSFESERARVQDEQARLESDIFELEARQLDAQRSENRERALSLDDQVFERKQYLRNYLTVKNRQLADMVSRLSESDEFLSEMTSAIEFIAESEGYSVILNKASNLFLFFVPEVDITDLVIAELSRRASR